jgi:hypothetical protein
MSLQECMDHTADGICWKCAPDDQCPDWWVHLRIDYWQKRGRQIIGTCDPICARPRYRNPMHECNAVSPFKTPYSISGLKRGA